jgi:hypothetical protein
MRPSIKCRREVARVLALGIVVLAIPEVAAQTAFKPAPAVALEAEDFTVESGWKIIKSSQGKHVSGERLLGVDGKDETASAFADVTVPETGAYRLWVRHAYRPARETRFRVIVWQDGQVVLDHVMGKKDSHRYAPGRPVAETQPDPVEGAGGVDLVDEVVSVPTLSAGKARIHLQATAQPQTPGLAAERRIDLVYLTRDTDDAWRKHYAKKTPLYPILDAFRDARGPRYEVRFTNRGKKPADFRVRHCCNRLPWLVDEPKGVRVAVGEGSNWLPLRLQDTAHSSTVSFQGPAQPFAVEVRPIGGTVEKRLEGSGLLRVYLPPYPGKGERPITPVEEMDAILKELRAAPAVGRVPTQPLCFGGGMPLGLEDEYGRKYAELYAALGLRSLHPAHSGPAVLANLRRAGVPPTRSWAVSSYRNPPLPGNIEQAKTSLARNGLKDQLRFYDYGEDISFPEWMRLLLEEEAQKARLEGKPMPAPAILARMWLEWLRANRPDVPLGEYWLEKWGPFTLVRMRPDSSAATAESNPRLYVDSLLFYEDSAIRFLAAGAKQVRAALGREVLCGASGSCRPFGYPSTTQLVKWFRGGAAEFGGVGDRSCQGIGPLSDGYVAEHFRCGMRDNSRAVLRACVLPHSQSTSEADVLRSAFTNLAHGATLLDFQGVGMNETAVEDHIDHRDHGRYRAIRDVTHAVGLVEDLLPESRPVPSPVALLVSASSERWDLAAVAEDRAGQAPPGPDFRKVRLTAHVERLGLWTALTFLGCSPDLLVEEDVTAKELKDRKLLVVVGDCLPPKMAAELEAWVRGGGVLLATAGTGRFDPYRQPVADFAKLFGLTARRTEERDTFIRPQQELPLLRPLGTMVGEAGHFDGEMPCLATFEQIEPDRDVRVRGHFKEGGPAILERRLGKGRVYYVASLPGVAYLWSALRSEQAIPTDFNPGARTLLEAILTAAKIEPAIRATMDGDASEGAPVRIDARLLKTPKGFIVPIANYQATVGQKVTLSMRAGVAIRKAASAYHGELKVESGPEGVTVTIPSLGYGDLLRLDP